jgi:hypothetical protein
VDEEESYFESDDDEGGGRSTVVPTSVDEIAAQEVENELHRTPRMFSLAQAPLLNNVPLQIDQSSRGEMNDDSTETKHDSGDKETVQISTEED